MQWDQAIILGIVQGLTEFLPVSSSGHLVLFQNLFGITQHNITFDIAVHLGTVFSVLTIYRRTLWTLVRQFGRFLIKKERNDGTILIGWICLGTIPTGIIGLLLKDFFEGLFSSPLAVGLFMWITGFILFATTKRKAAAHEVTESWTSDSDPASAAKSLSVKKALLIGLAQGCAIAPGISRSGATIATSLFLGVPRQTAALFSFLLSIPAILGATTLQISHINTQELDILLIGMVVSYLTGLVGLWSILKIVKRGRLELFSPYMWLIGTILMWQALG